MRKERDEGTSLVKATGGRILGHEGLPKKEVEKRQGSRQGKRQE